MTLSGNGFLALLIVVVIFLLSFGFILVWDWGYDTYLKRAHEKRLRGDQKKRLASVPEDEAARSHHEKAWERYFILHHERVAKEHPRLVKEPPPRPEVYKYLELPDVYEHEHSGNYRDSAPKPRDLMQEQVALLENQMFRLEELARGRR